MDVEIDIPPSERPLWKTLFSETDMTLVRKPKPFYNICKHRQEMASDNPREVDLSPLEIIPRSEQECTFICGMECYDEDDETPGPDVLQWKPIFNNYRRSRELHIECDRHFYDVFSSCTEPVSTLDLPVLEVFSTVDAFDRAGDRSFSASGLKHLAARDVWYYRDMAYTLISSRAHLHLWGTGNNAAMVEEFLKKCTLLEYLWIPISYRIEDDVQHEQVDLPSVKAFRIDVLKNERKCPSDTLSARKLSREGQTRTNRLTTCTRLTNFNKML